MRRLRPKLLAVALRRGWLVVLVTIGVTAIASVAASGRTVRYTAESVVVVPAGASDVDPGNATQATQLAQTYLETIPEDGGALLAVAKVLGRDPDAVAEDIEVIGSPQTSALRLRFEDGDRDRALVAASRLLSTVTAAAPAARSVAPGSLIIVRQPRIVDETSAGGSGGAIPIGIFLGLCLGIALVVGWERSDPRIDTARELRGEAGTPATALHDVKSGNVGVLIERWSGFADAADGNGSSGARTVAILAATRSSEDLVGDAAARLADLGQDGGHALVLGRNGRTAVNGEPRLVLTTGGTPGGPSAGEARAAEAALVVLAVGRGARATELRATLVVLEQFGVSPAWALFVRR